MTQENKERREDKIRKMAELRVSLERRINELQTELDQLRALLDLVNSALLERSFKKPEITKSPAPTPVTEEPAVPSPPSPIQVEATSFSSEYAEATPIRTVAGELLANLYTNEEAIHVVLAQDKQFTVDIPPFTAFLVDRVLTKMQEKDRESARAGEIPPDKVLSYEIVKDGDAIRELVIKNVILDRARELKSTIRWTLERMYEKMKSAP